MLYIIKASKYHCFVGNWESYGNIANVRDLISLIYSHKIPKWGKLNEIIYFYNRVLIRLYTTPERLLAGKIGNIATSHQCQQGSVEEEEGGDVLAWYYESHPMSQFTVSHINIFQV